MQERVEGLQAQLAASEEAWPAAGVQAPGGGALGAHALARVDTHAAFSDLFAGPKLKVRRLPRKHPYKGYIL